MEREKRYPVNAADYKLYKEVGKDVSVIVYRALYGPCSEIIVIIYRALFVLFNGFEELIIITFLSETFKAIVYLHYLGHIHRDVKARSILIDSNGFVKLYFN
ncbi:hypothetical protein ACFE04_014089 [Oxalis oulophora]